MSDWEKIKAAVKAELARANIAAANDSWAGDMVEKVWVDQLLHRTQQDEQTGTLQIRIGSPITVGELVQMANDSPHAWEACRLKLKQYHDEGTPPPAELAEWAHKALGGDSAKKKKRGTPSSKNLIRDLTIALAVFRAREAGLMAYCNDKGYNNTACVLVAEVLAELGVHMSVGTVTSIWRRFNAKGGD